MAGDPAGAFAILRPLRELVAGPGTGTDIGLAGMGTAMGELHRRAGDLPEALRWFTSDRAAAVPAGDTCLAAITGPPLARALRQAGRPAEAVTVLDAAVASALRHAMSGHLADARDQQAHLAEDPEQALDLHHEALGARVELGLRGTWPDSLDGIAAALAGTGRTADAARTLAAGDRARAELGYPRAAPEQAAADALRLAVGPAETPMALDDAVACVRRTRGKRGRPAAGWASLTPTERDVVALAVEGLSNPEIGTRLYIGRGTVKTHLAHVYAKLGVANRTELAAMAARDS